MCFPSTEQGRKSSRPYNSQMAETAGCLPVSMAPFLFTKGSQFLAAPTTIPCFSLGAKYDYVTRLWSIRHKQKYWVGYPKGVLTRREVHSSSTFPFLCLEHNVMAGAFAAPCEDQDHSIWEQWSRSLALDNQNYSILNCLLNSLFYTGQNIRHFSIMCYYYSFT